MSNSPYVVKTREDRIDLWKGARPALTRLDMELTERCNNDCVHCYINLPAGDAAAKERELGIQTVRDVLKEATDLGCLKVRFTGGEPLLRADFEDVYLSARSLGLRVLLFTNGTLLSPSLAGLFARIPPLERVEITCYGMTQDSYEEVTRAPGSYSAALRGVNLLKEYGIPFALKFALLPSNRHEKAQFETWAVSMLPEGEAPSFVGALDLRCRHDSADRNRRIRALRLAPGEVGKILGWHEAPYQEHMMSFCAAHAGRGGDRLFTCGAGDRAGAVDAYGALQPCLLLRHPETTYDLKSGSLADALNCFFPVIREKRAQNPDYLIRCARCFLKGLCQQCPAKSWMEHASLDTPIDYLCEIAHEQARCLGLLRKRERAWEVSDGRSRIRTVGHN